MKSGPQSQPCLLRQDPAYEVVLEEEILEQDPIQRVCERQTKARPDINSESLSL